MPSIIIQQAVTNVDILIEPIVNTYTVLISEMQMPGISAYQVAVNNGFVGTEAEWLASFKNHLLLTNIGVNTHAQIDTDLTRLAGTSGTNTGDQDLSGKVDKVTGKSLILDTEITRLAGVSNVDISGLELLSNKKTDIEANKTSNTFFASIKAIYDWTKTQTIENITLLQANWTLVAGLYEYNYANAAILVDSIIEIIPYNSTIETVRQAEVLPMVISTAGTVKLYAKYLPAANILIALNIQK